MAFRARVSSCRFQTPTTLPLRAVPYEPYSTFLDSLLLRDQHGAILPLLQNLHLSLHLRRSLSYGDSVLISPPASKLEAIYPQIIPFTIYIMKSVLVWAGFAITQVLLAASAPVGPSGPCPDVRIRRHSFYRGVSY